MIRSWGSSATRRLFETGVSRFGGLDVELALDMVGVLAAAPTLAPLVAMRSVRLHKLRGDRAGQWALRLNGPWRLCFRFRDGDAYDVEIVDYH